MPVTRRKWKTSKGEPRETWGFSFYDPLTKKQVNKSVYKNTVVDPKTLASNRKVDMTNELSGKDIRTEIKELTWK